MSDSVLISVNPEWCELIASGIKTVEVRKTRPKLETPFKVYIYCTLPRKSGDIFLVAGKTIQGNGKVIGEFVCDAIFPMSITYSDTESRIALKEFPFTCMTDKQIIDYLGNGKEGYAWHISDLKIYDKPRELSEFKQCHKCEYYADCYEHEYSCDGVYNLTRPPQSWCYVEVT